MRQKRFGILGGIILGLVSFPVFATTINLTGTIRDFPASHPDFEGAIGGVETGIVETTLGADDNPVRSSQVSGQTTEAGESPGFGDWYNDTPNNVGVTSHTITLDNTITADPNVFSYVDGSFFPIDGMLGGNEGNSHNFHFTYEIHSSFTYQGGETFSFTGDDDLWVFINDQLVVDIGGVHSAASGSVDLDTLGLAMGNTYSFDLFFAERHRTASNFNIDTSIVLQQDQDNEIPEPATLGMLATGLFGVGYSVRRRKKA